MSPSSRWLHSLKHRLQTVCAWEGRGSFVVGKKRTPGFMASRSVKIGTEGICGLPGCGVLLQKEIHALEIDDGIALVERVDSQNAADSGAALPQCEAR